MQTGDSSDTGQSHNQAVSFLKWDGDGVSYHVIVCLSYLIGCLGKPIPT